MAGAFLKHASGDVVLVHAAGQENENEMSESIDARASRIISGLHDSIEHQRGIVNLCDRVLSYRSLALVHGPVRHVRASAETEIARLRMLAAAVQLTRKLTNASR